MRHTENYRVLALGDVHFGENYRTGAQALQAYGYSHSTTHLRRFAKACDAFVLNLETPLVDPEVYPSPLHGKKAIIHWGDPGKVGAELKDLGVDAVSLGNNHALDHGLEGLESTFQALSGVDIPWFGAGRTLDEAREPFRLTLPSTIGGGEIHIHGSFQYSKLHDKQFGFYAGNDSAGCAPLSMADVPRARRESTKKDSLQIAFPHWPPNYDWRRPKQYQLAHRLLQKDYDLILAHGGHILQEIHRKRQRWVVYGIGNGNFMAASRKQPVAVANGMLPFSLWAVIEVQRNRGRRGIRLKLYPVYSNNTFTNFQPGPVSAADFAKLVPTLMSRPARPWRFDNPARSTGVDGLGHFLELDLGEWQEGERPLRLPAAETEGDPNDWPLRGPNTELEDRVLGTGRSLGPGMVAHAAEAAGAKVQWVSRRAALITHGDKRMLIQDYSTHESVLGKLIVDDSVLLANLLEEAGVPTRKSVYVDSADSAVRVARAMGSRVVIRSADIGMGNGPTTVARREEEVREAYALARDGRSSVIVQQYIEAAEAFRIIALSAEVLAVNKRVLPRVVGDGKSTVSQLIDDKNLQRDLNPVLRDRPIVVDASVHRQLGSIGLSSQSVIELGRKIIVRDGSDTSVGGDVDQTLTTTDSKMQEVGARAVGAVPGLGWGGVELLIEKGSGSPYVVDIDAGAAYGEAVFPTYGEPRDVARGLWKHLLESATPDPVTPPDVAEPRPDRAAITGFSHSDKSTNQEFSLLFEESLIRQKYCFNLEGRSVLKVRLPRGECTWMSRNGMTAGDRHVVWELMRDHRGVLQLLGIAGVPRPSSQVIGTNERLRRFVKLKGALGVLVNPLVGAWNGPDSGVLIAGDAMHMRPFPEKMLVQTRRAGERVRVLATREKAEVITANAATGALGRRYIRVVGELAVRAVRAIPELRWAAVDIVVRPALFEKDSRNAVLVEGMTLTPRYSCDDQILAGDFDEFCRWLVEPRSDNGMAQ